MPAAIRRGTRQSRRKHNGDPDVVGTLGSYNVYAFGQVLDSEAKIFLRITH
jgi:hypothetical protein